MKSALIVAALAVALSTPVFAQNTATQPAAETQQKKEVKKVKKKERKKPEAQTKK